MRYAETDQMGIAHHASYVVYLEDARTRMLAERGCPYGSLEERGFGLVLRSIEVRYRASARFDQELVVRTRVERVRGASVALDYELCSVEGGQTLATARTELACVRLAPNGPTPAPLPEDVRKLLEASIGSTGRPA